MRLNKYIAQSGIASRRGAEAIILAGRITINGVVVRDLSITVGTEDSVACDGASLSHPEAVRLWKYHKPRGVICTDSDPQGRPTLHEQLPESLGRVLSVGRLDVESEGLLLLTNDGALKRTLELPATHIPRTYQVRFYGELTKAHIAEIQAGVTIEGMHYQPVGVRMSPRASEGKNRWCEMTLYEGKNREIRRIFAHYGCRVSRLRRISYGTIALGALGANDVEEIMDAQATVAHILSLSEAK